MGVNAIADAIEQVAIAFFTFTQDLFSLYMLIDLLFQIQHLLFKFIYQTLTVEFEYL